MAKNQKKATLEDAFMAAWEQHYGQLAKPVRQHPVRNPETGKDWRLDFSWPEQGLAVEIQGCGRHTRLVGQAKDYDRHNYLVSQGWRVLYFNAINLKSMEGAVTIAAEVLCNAREV